MIEIKHLRMLRALRGEGSLSGAARVLGYSQPAVTQQLQALERIVGTPVMLRGGPGVRLTPVGELLLAHGESILDTIDLAAVEIESLRSLSRGTIRVATFPSAAATIVPAAMRSIRDRHPGITFSLVEATPPEALKMLAAGRCDVAVVFQYSSEPEVELDVVRQPLMHERVHVAFGPDLDIADGETISIQSLENVAWIAGCPKCSGNIIESCRSAGFEPHIGFETDDYVAVQSLALSGFGVSLIPDLILSIIRLPGLRLARPDPMLTRRIDAVTTPGLLLTPGVGYAVHALQDAARAFVVANSASRSAVGGVAA